MANLLKIVDFIGCLRFILFPLTESVFFLSVWCRRTYVWTLVNVLRGTRASHVCDVTGTMWRINITWRHQHHVTSLSRDAKGVTWPVFRGSWTCAMNGCPKSREWNRMSKDWMSYSLIKLYIFWMQTIREPRWFQAKCCLTVVHKYFTEYLTSAFIA